MRYVRLLLLALLTVGASLFVGSGAGQAQEPLPEFSGPDFEVPPPEPPGAAGQGGAPGYWQTSEFMAGKIVYSVVFVESSGGTGNCSPAAPRL